MTAFPNSVWDGDSDSRDSDQGINASPTWQDWVRMLEEVQSMQTKTLVGDHTTLGTLNIYDGLTGSVAGNDALHKITFVFTDMLMTITDAGVAGAHGSIKLYTFTDGHAAVFVGCLDGTLSAGSGGIANNAALDLAVGSVTVDTGDETLSLTEQNITTKEDVTLTGGSKAFDILNLTPVDMDGELSVYLNVAIEGASCNADDVLTFNGIFTMTWNNHH